MLSIVIHTIGRFNYRHVKVTKDEELKLISRYEAKEIQGILHIGLSENSFTNLLNQLIKLGRI